MWGGSQGPGEDPGKGEGKGVKGLHRWKGRDGRSSAVEMGLGRGPSRASTSTLAKD